MSYFRAEQGRNLGSASRRRRGLGAAGPSDDNIRRELYAAAVSEAVDNWRKKIDAALAGQLSLSTIAGDIIKFPPNIAFASLQADSRAYLKEARRLLVEQFLPSAVNAIRDYTRSLENDIKPTIDAFYKDINATYGISIDVANTSSFQQVIKDLAKDPTKTVPWWIYAGGAVLGLGVVGYVVRAFR